VTRDKQRDGDGDHLSAKAISRTMISYVYLIVKDKTFLSCSSRAAPRTQL
jgi:hypothetical protein